MESVLPDHALRVWLQLLARLSLVFLVEGRYVRHRSVDPELLREEAEKALFRHVMHALVAGEDPYRAAGAVGCSRHRTASMLEWLFRLGYVETDPGSGVNLRPSRLGFRVVASDSEYREPLNTA